MTDDDRSFEKLLETAADRSSPYRVQRNHLDGAFMVLPNVPVYASNDPRQREIEDAWETRAIAMHQAQEHINLSDLPVSAGDSVNRLQERFTMARQGPTEPPKFEDGPEACKPLGEKPLTLTRGN